MKKYTLLTAIILVSLSSFAQETETQPLSFNIGGELAVPVSNLSNISSFGFGISALGEYRVVEAFSVTLSAGYIHFFGKSFGGYTAPSLGQVPLLAGGRYYFIKNVYASGQLGISIFNKGLGSGFTYVPGIGAKFSNLDATLKYMGASVEGGTLSNISLRFAYAF